MGPKIWCERQRLKYALMILKKIFNEAVEDTKTAKAEADEAYKRFDPNVESLFEACEEYGRIQECLTPFRFVKFTISVCCSDIVWYIKDV